MERRTLVKGAAWATPVIVVGSVAPAAAASPAIVMSHTTTWRWYLNAMPGCAGQADGLQINTTEGGGVSFSNTRTSTSITNVQATFWFARSDFTWSADAGNSGCWTAPTATGQSSGGLYAYASTYTCAITPVNGTTTLRPYAWRTQCVYESDTSWESARTVRRVASGTVNGATQTTDTGRFTIQS